MNNVKALRKNKAKNNPCSARSISFSILFSFLFLLFSFTSNAQEISASIDTTSIKIGEQIKYQITVEADSSATITFPEGQSFSPLEMVETYTIDSSTIDAQLRMVKEYALTKFDSGSYVIPPQRVLIGQKEILTDSFLVEVRPVVVDTTKQEMYPIKPSLDIPERFHFPKWLWWVLGGLILLGGIIYLLIKKKKEEAKRNIPPYEKAMLSLKELDEGSLLADREIKTYYSVLTDAARRYLDEKVDNRAMESTTSELIDRLQLQKDAGKLNIEQAIIDDFERILKRADLAKFARSKPGVITAKEDRGHIEKIINDTKKGIPEPTEEELQKDEIYRKKYVKKQKRKRIAIWLTSGIVLLALIITALIATKGITYVKDLAFGNDTKELLKGDWITSEYGNPPVTITTPEVLIRTADSVSQNDASSLTQVETFSSGNLYSDFYIILSTGKLKKQPKATSPGSSDSNAQNDDTNIFSQLGIDGTKNILMKQEEFETDSGIQGIKITGSFSVTNKESGENINKEYVLLNFGQRGGQQKILLVFNKEDEYAKQIVSRVVYSVELNKPGN